jgi:hypothetical protein
MSRRHECSRQWGSGRAMWAPSVQRERAWWDAHCRDVMGDLRGDIAASPSVDDGRLRERVRTHVARGERAFGSHKRELVALRSDEATRVTPLSAARAL